jgi:hypothetical protein
LAMKPDRIIIVNDDSRATPTVLRMLIIAHPLPGEF